MINKKKIKDSLEQLIANKVYSLLEDVKLIDDSAANETKSSAGDKYETSRAMLQQEKDKKLGQLDLWYSHQAALKLLDTAKHDTIQLGSVVITQTNVLYVSAPAGKFQFEGKQVFAISNEAPLYQVLAGYGKDDQVSFNGRMIKIVDVL